jgi:hypothetical protein
MKKNEAFGSFASSRGDVLVVMICCSKLVEYDWVNAMLRDARSEAGPSGGEFDILLCCWAISFRGWRECAVAGIKFWEERIATRQYVLRILRCRLATS